MAAKSYAMRRGAQIEDNAAAPLPARLTLAYMLAATVWILLSDRALLLWPELTQLPWLPTVKGLCFVAVTGGLLYLLLNRARRQLERMHTSLLASEESYRRLAEQAPDMLYRYRLLPDQGFEYVNPAVTALTGYPPDDHYADPQLVLRLVHEDDRPALVAVLAGQSFDQPLTLRWLRPDGQMNWVELRNIALRDATGEVVAVEGIARDVSERQRNAARLRLLETALAAAASAVVITDRDGVIQWVNDAFTRLTGHPAPAVIGRKPSLLRSGEHPDSFYQQLWETVLGGAVWRGELINRRADGARYYEEQTITPVREPGGAITHFIAIKQDVTERVNRERAQRTLAALAVALRDVAARSQLPPVLLKHTTALLGVEAAALAIYEQGVDTMRIEAGAGAWAGAAGARLPPGGDLSRPEELGAPSPARANVMHDERGPEHPLDRCAVAASVELRWQHEVIGALWAGYDRPPTPSDLQVLEQVAELAGSELHRATLHEQTAQRLRRLTGLHAIDQSIAASHDIRVTLGIVLEQATSQLGVDAAAVLLLDPQHHALHFRGGRGFRRDAVGHTRIALGEGLVGEAVLARRAIRLPVIPASGETFTRGELLAAEGFVAYYAEPLIAKGQVRGMLELFHRGPLAPDAEWLHFLETLAGHLAIAIDNAELFERLQRSNDELGLAYDSTLEGWARALELRDNETEGHCRRVTTLTERLARALGVDDDALVHIRRGALLHDIGKMGVPDSILHKPGPLSDDEWALMREHPVLAYRLLSPIAYLHPALEIPYAHHERWDGSGYPRQLAGDAIPLAARIFAVVDVWDALINARAYKPAWGAEQAAAYLREQAGRQFDPQVVAAFLALIEHDGAAVAPAHEGANGALPPAGADMLATGA